METRHALHGVTWPVSNPKTLQVDFSTTEAFEKAKTNEETEGPPVSTIPGTVEDWLREQDMKRERGELVRIYFTECLILQLLQFNLFYCKKVASHDLVVSV